MSPSKTATTKNDLQSAKGAFTAAIQQGMQVLMQDCGYSRDRATAILLRELQSKSTMQRPSDQEMFETMRIHGLGTEEATRALIVSKVFEREAKQGSSTKALAQAIQKLVSNISVSKLMYESDDDSLMDVASDREEESLTIRSELRVNPVAKSRTASTSSETQEQPMPTVAISGRKRKIQEAASEDIRPNKLQKQKTAAKPTEKRPRADSVTEQVDAKITAILPAATTAGASRTAKRHHREMEADTRTADGTAVGVTEAGSAVDQRE